MPWLTRAHVEARFGADFVAQSEASDVDVPSILTDAEAEVDSYLARVVSLPLSTLPANIVRIGAIVARYNLLRRDVTEDHPAWIAYRQALRELEGIASGQIDLGLPPDPADAPPPGQPLVLARPAVFTATELGKMVL